MSTTAPIAITIETTVNVPVEIAWTIMTEPVHITKWNAASPDWHTPRAENDCNKGGKFSFRMEAKDILGYEQYVIHSLFIRDGFESLPYLSTLIQEYLYDFHELIKKNVDISNHVGDSSAIYAVRYRH